MKKHSNMSAKKIFVVTGQGFVSLAFLFVGVFFIDVMLKNGFSGFALGGGLIGFAFSFWQLKRLINVFRGKNTRGKREKEDHVSW